MMAALQIDPPPWEMKNARGFYAEALLELGEEYPDMVVCDADLAHSTRTFRFGERYPDRFFNFGIAEQNMMSTAAGLASTERPVFVSTFAIFATGRPFDQIRQSIAYPNMNVKIVATHAGISVGGDGASHQINEDLALMRALPNMRIIAPADGPEAKAAVKYVAGEPGPFYVRLGRVDWPVIFNEDHAFSFGESPVVRTGDDVSILAIGLMVSRAVEAALMLEKEGIDAAVIDCSTVKPLDERTIVDAAKRTGALVTAEEHSTIGGLGSAVATLLAEKYPVPMHRVALEDTFCESGDAWELLECYGLTADRIAEAARSVLRRKE